MPLIVVFMLLFTISIRFGCTLNIEMTVNVEPGREDCFYEKFTQDQTIEVDYQVITGGQGGLDITFHVRSPSGQMLAQDVKESDNAHSVVAPENGVYAFCWDNSFSHFSSKTVFFEIYLGDSNEEDDLWKTNFSDLSYDGWFAGEAYDMKIEDIKSAMRRLHDFLTTIRTIQQQRRSVEARDRMLAEKNFDYVNLWAIAQITVMFVVGIIQGSDGQELAGKAQRELGALAEWLSNNQLVMSSSKSKTMQFCLRKWGPEVNDLELLFQDQTLPSVSSTTFLGFEIDSALKWDDHIDTVVLIRNLFEIEQHRQWPWKARR